MGDALSVPFIVSCPHPHPRPTPTTHDLYPRPTTHDPRHLATLNRVVNKVVTLESVKGVGGGGRGERLWIHILIGVGKFQ